MCMTVLPTCMYITRVLSAQKGQKRALDSLELELRMIVSTGMEPCLL